MQSSSLLHPPHSRTGNPAHPGARTHAPLVLTVVVQPHRNRPSCSLQSVSRGRSASRGCTVVCRATAKSFYDILEVPPNASERDIKASYRKKAMKLHPDVNKAPDAQERFMEAKVAYETLSDAKQRAEYDRRLRMGFGGGARAGYSGNNSYGGGARGRAGTGAGAGYNPQPEVGLDDLIRELEKEFTSWANSQRSKGSKEKSLMEELEDIGSELLDFLEESLGIKDEPAQQSQRDDYRPPRSAAEKYDQFWSQFGDGPAGAAAPGAGPRPGSSSTSAPPPPPPPQPPSKATRPEDDIEEQLKALKKKLNKT